MTQQNYALDNGLDIARRQVWQAQADNDPNTWEGSILRLMETDTSTPALHAALNASLQALFYNPALKETAAHMLLYLADKIDSHDNLESKQHAIAVRHVVSYHFDIVKLENATISEFGSPAVQTPRPCAAPPR